MRLRNDGILFDEIETEESEEWDDDENFEDLEDLGRSKEDSEDERAKLEFEDEVDVNEARKLVGL
jgi:hypothetical protein